MGYIYCDSNNPDKDVLSSYFRRLRYVSDDGTLDEDSIKQEGKHIFKLYSQMIHGGSSAQQYPLPSNDFYINIEEMLQETALWIMCFSGVILSYIHKCLQAADTEYKQQENYDNCNWLLDGKFMVGNYLSGIVFSQIDKLRQITSKAEQTKMYKIFTKTKWIIGT